MASFFDAADRLRRKVWGDIGELANEVWTVFKTGRVDTSRPASFSNEDDPTAPPITTRQPQNDAFPAIQIERGDNVVTITLGDDGDLIFGNENGDPIQIRGVDGIDGTSGEDGGSGDPGDPGTPGDTTTRSAALAGVIVSRVGGAVYNVRCFDQDPSSAAPIGTVAMTAANLEPDDVIPTGFEVIAVGFFNTSTGVLTGGRIYPPVFVSDV